METESTFRYRYDARGVRIMALVDIGSAAFLFFWSYRLPLATRLTFAGADALFGLVATVYLHRSFRRLSLNAWVRVRPTGLTLCDRQGVTQELDWAQIASIAPAYEVGQRFAGLLVTTRDGRYLQVDHRLERGEELCGMIWDTGRFVATGGPEAPRWVPKAAQPLPAPDGVTN